jgi:ribosomal protein S18 acetylase RimI-like enzyme
MHRFDAYTDPTRASGFEMVVAQIDGTPAGQTWGWPLTANSVWWKRFQPDADALDRDTFVAEDGAPTFALSEIMVCAEFAGRGLARALHDELLADQTHQRATLLVEPDNTRAYNTYRKWGWYRVGTLRPSWPDAPTFDVLIYDLHPAVRLEIHRGHRNFLAYQAFSLPLHGPQLFGLIDTMPSSATKIRKHRLRRPTDPGHRPKVGFG